MINNPKDATDWLEQFILTYATRGPEAVEAMLMALGRTEMRWVFTKLFVVHARTFNELDDMTKAYDILSKTTKDALDALAEATQTIKELNDENEKLVNNSVVKHISEID